MHVCLIYSYANFLLKQMGGINESHSLDTQPEKTTDCSLFWRPVSKNAFSRVRTPPPGIHEPSSRFCTPGTPKLDYPLCTLARSLRSAAQARCKKHCPKVKKKNVSISEPFIWENVNFSYAYMKLYIIEIEIPGAMFPCPNWTFCTGRII